MEPSSMAKLSERLQQQLQADQEAIQSQTKELLMLHAESLKKLSADALNITRAATDRQHRRMLQDLAQVSQESTRRMRWMLLWPVLSSLVLSLLLVGSAGLYSWWTIGQAAQVQLQIKRLTAKFCATPAGRQACKTR